jgi:hypothetical protein
MNQVVHFIKLTLKSLTVVIYFILLANIFANLNVFFIPDPDKHMLFYDLEYAEKWRGNVLMENISYIIIFTIISIHLYWFTGLKTRWKLFLFGFPLILMSLLGTVAQFYLWYKNGEDIANGFYFLMTTVVMFLLLINSPKIDFSRYTGLSEINKWHLTWLWIPVIFIIPPFFLYLLLSIRKFLMDIIDILSFNFSITEAFKDFILAIFITVLYKISYYTFNMGLLFISGKQKDFKKSIKNMGISWLIFIVGVSLLYGVIYLFQITAADFVFEQYL